VVDEGPDQAAQQVGVGAAPLGPLVVDLEQHDVVGPDDAVRPDNGVTVSER